MKEQHDQIVKSQYAPVSWQLEFLIAGGIIFSLYTSTDYFKHLFLLKYPISDFNYIQVLLFFGTYVLTRVLLIGFGVNLILRTVWLAYSAISYWYPDGVNYDHLNINFYQKKKHQNGLTASDRLATLDKWTNVSFAVTIVFTFIVFSSFITLMLIQFILAEVFGAYDLINNAVFNYFIAIFVLLLQLGVFDFLIRKRHRRGVFFKIGEWLYQVYYYATGLFLFRRELLVIRTNGKRWLYLTFGSLYLLAGLFISINQIGEFYPAGTFNINVFDDRLTFSEDLNYIIDYHTYEDQLGENEVFYNGGIQSQYVTDEYLKVFVVHWRNYDWYLRHVQDSIQYPVVYDPPRQDSLRIAYNNNRIAKDQIALNQLIALELDEELITDLKWERYQHYKTKEEGYITYIPITDLASGRHIISVFTRNRFTGTVRKSRVFGTSFFKP